MTRFLQNSLILVSILLAPSFTGVAQNNPEPTDSRTAKEILQSYGGIDHAVIQMTREEWDIVRAWEEFDENTYLGTRSWVHGRSEIMK